MSPAFGVLNIISESFDVFIKTFGVLDGQFDGVVPYLAFYIKRRLIEYGFIPVEVLDIATDSALKVVAIALSRRTVSGFDVNTCSEISLVAQVIKYCLVVKSSFLENTPIRPKANGCTSAAGCADRFNRPLRTAELIFLLVQFSVFMNFGY